MSIYHTGSIDVVSGGVCRQTKWEAEEPMREREHLAQADRFIAECKNRIARQRDVIASAFQKGQATEVPVSMLRALEASLRAFEGHRLLIVDRQKDAERR
jgi:hypothetical protein